MAAEDHQHKYSMRCIIALDETKPDNDDLGCKEKARKINKRGSSAQTQKKKPQRGMGVAQLERLRLQEMGKKMTEMPPPDPHNLQTQFHYHYYSNHFPLPEPIPSVPVMHGTGRYGVPSVAAAGWLMGNLDQGLVYQSHGNDGDGGGGCGSGHVLMDPSRVGGSLSVVETSKELSSIPKLQQQHLAVVPERCDFCFKKTRFNGDNKEFNGGKDKYAEFSQENSINFNGGIKSTFGSRAAKSAFYAGHHNLNEGLQVVAVHRNGNSSTGRNVVMEYEFFPAGQGGRRSTSSKELGLPTEAEASVAVVGGEASYFTTSAYNNNDNKPKAASNSVDLSLKLSY